MIELRQIDQENFNDVIRLKVKPEQKNFISSVEKSLARAYVNRDNIFPFAIYNDNVLIGFIMCRYNLEYNNMFIWQFFIDKNYQNMGYGKLALIKIIEWIESYKQGIDIITTVKKGNRRAEKMYESIGFVLISDTMEEESDYKLNKLFYKENKNL